MGSVPLEANHLVDQSRVGRVVGQFENLVFVLNRHDFLAHDAPVSPKLRQAADLRVLASAIGPEQFGQQGVSVSSAADIRPTEPRHVTLHCDLSIR